MRAMNSKGRDRNRTAERSLRIVGSLACAAVVAACGGSSSDAGAGASSDALQGIIGPRGGELVGQAGSALDGVHLVIPPGALSADTTIAIRPADSDAALPKTAVRCGPEFTIEPAGLELAVPATLTLPFDESAVTTQDRFDDEVKVWILGQDSTWGQQLQTDSAPGEVSVQLEALAVAAAGVNPPAPVDVVHLSFKPNPKFESCLAANPGDATRAPSVEADVVRGSRNDGLFLRGKNIKPNLQFDLFTVEHSALLPSGAPDPSFTNFGLAWYQSDLEAESNGSMYATIRTILLDQIFGFDPSVNLPPTSTFEVGFWFNDPQDAVACGFDPTKPTPFNGEHRAGPLAMITVPDATTGLGPLCTKPDTSVSPARCDP
jgi:ZU5 domain